MQYLSIDVETTGLDKENHQILSIGAIFEDTEKKLSFEEIPKFHGAILHEELKGSPFAINLNKDLISTIVSYQGTKSEDTKRRIEEESGMKFYKETEIVEAFYHFLHDCGLIPFSLTLEGVHTKIINGKSYPMIGMKTKPIGITCAGKNFGTFDKVFLERLPRWNQVVKVKQRILDPSILYVDWKKDAEVPGLGKCKERAGYDKVVSHNAVEDAWDIIRLLRKQYT